MNNESQKHPQIIRGCYFPAKAIPDTLNEFMLLYESLPIYASIPEPERKNEMENDFKKLVSGQTSGTNISHRAVNFRKPRAKHK